MKGVARRVRDSPPGGHHIHPPSRAAAAERAASQRRYIHDPVTFIVAAQVRDWWRRPPDVGVRDRRTAVVVDHRAQGPRPPRHARRPSRRAAVARLRRYTLENFGAVLHHNFDKLALLGGASEVRLRRRPMTAPVRVLVNGRAARTCGDERIPVDEIVENTVRTFFAERLPASATTSTSTSHHQQLQPRRCPTWAARRSAPGGSRRVGRATCGSGR